MLEIRPNCENCNCELAPNSTEAMICSFECTFCRGCVDTTLNNVCPNCGGNFNQRPIRPFENLKDDNYLGKFPSSTKRLHRPVDSNSHLLFSNNIATIPPEDR